jgi:hypothetical protein
MKNRGPPFNVSSTRLHPSLHPPVFWDILSYETYHIVSECAYEQSTTYRHLAEFLCEPARAASPFLISASITAYSPISLLCSSCFPHTHCCIYFLPLNLTSVFLVLFSNSVAISCELSLTDRSAFHAPFLLTRQKCRVPCLHQLAVTVLCFLSPYADRPRCVACPLVLIHHAVLCSLHTFANSPRCVLYLLLISHLSPFCSFTTLWKSFRRLLLFSLLFILSLLCIIFSSSAD